MTATTNTEHRAAPASAQARATKAERVAFLNRWAMDNPLRTIEEARQAVRAQFGMSLGTQALSNAMRLARETWEAQRKTALEHRRAPTMPEAPTTPPSDMHEQLAALTAAMKSAGLRLVEILEDGRVRVEFYA